MRSTRVRALAVLGVFYLLGNLGNLRPAWADEEQEIRHNHSPGREPIQWQAQPQEEGPSGCFTISLGTSTNSDPQTTPKPSDAKPRPKKGVDMNIYDNDPSLDPSTPQPPPVAPWPRRSSIPNSHHTS